MGHPLCSHCNEGAVIRLEGILIDSCNVFFPKKTCWLLLFVSDVALVRFATHMAVLGTQAKDTVLRILVLKD